MSIKHRSPTVYSAVWNWEYRIGDKMTCQMQAVYLNLSTLQFNLMQTQLEPLLREIFGQNPLKMYYGHSYSLVDWAGLMKEKKKFFFFSLIRGRKQIGQVQASITL